MTDHATTTTRCSDCEAQQQKIADLRHRLKVNTDVLRVVTRHLDQLAGTHNDASGTNA